MKYHWFKINKNKHYSTLLDGFKPLFYIGKINKYFEITFNNTCIYDESKLPHSGINKLIGFTRIHHQEKLPILKKYCNSWLLGWRCVYENDIPKLKLYSYYDINGKEFKTELTGEYRFDIPIIINVSENNQFVVWNIEQGLKSITVFQPIHLKYPKLGYKLYPYFGGKSVAPHDMYISIKC
jgi:hypothetical protein